MSGRGLGHSQRMTTRTGARSVEREKTIEIESFSAGIIRPAESH